LFLFNFFFSNQKISFFYKKAIDQPQPDDKIFPLITICCGFLKTGLRSQFSS
jgi:hypothetical protein